MVEHASNRQILDSLMTAVIVLDTDLNITYLNASAEVLFGVSSEHLVHKPISYCFSQNDGTPTSLEEALRENRNFTRRKTQWKLHNQTEITLDYTVTPAPEIGRITIEVQSLDRLLRISREEAWISSQETSRNLVRSMAHEIKNPLGGIRGAAQLLARELVEEEHGEYTRIIIEETDRLRDLVDRMLGPRTLPKRLDLNIHEVIEHVVSIVSLETQDAVDIKRDYDPSIPNICGDKAQLVQAFLNIANNAIQALTENSTTDPTITICTRIKRRYTIGRYHYPLVVKVCFKDNGPGIPEDIINDIFFPMITGRTEGSGLGLSISQNLIGQHNGLIECNSEPGKTKFAVYLPVGNQDAQA
ncbi:MAG: two-component system nitrogen regulation sensor histidine kinase GlnL [Lentisphaeria bacterium]|jgi:two-component system nitrogen regulation sensor histidine kinase GlnL